MKSRIFKCLAVASAMMCALQIALWVRAHLGYSDSISIFIEGQPRGRSDLYRLSSRKARFELVVEEPVSVQKTPFYQSDRITRTRFFTAWGGSTFWRRAGLGHVHYDRTWRWSMPQWPFAFLFMILPLIWGICYVRRRRRQGHLCDTCGYDIRASKDHCPECGTAILTSRRDAMDLADQSSPTR